MFSQARRRVWRRPIAVALSVLALTTSCASLHRNPEPTVTSLVVRNRSYFDVNVYVLPSAGAQPVRVGTVVGTSSTTFPLRRTSLQNGGYLVVQVHAIGTRSRWTSDAVSIDEGVVAVLDVETDPFGDCSRSNLHTIITAESRPGS